MYIYRYTLVQIYIQMYISTEYIYIYVCVCAKCFQHFQALRSWQSNHPKHLRQAEAAVHKVLLRTRYTLLFFASSHIQSWTNAAVSNTCVNVTIYSVAMTLT